MPTETERPGTIKNTTQIEQNLLYYAHILIIVIYGECIPPDFFLDPRVKPRFSL
jgi:hypothetical protein